MRLGIVIINISAQRLERNLALHFLLRAGDFRAPQATADNDLNTLRARAYRLLNRLFHCPPEGDTLLQLLGNAPRHQISIEFWLANLQDIQPDLFAGLMFKTLAEVLHLLAAFANHNTWLGGMDGHSDLASSRALDLHF
jgi:hypothetical protein